MKTTLEFNLPEEKLEAELAMNASGMYSTLKQLDSILRLYRKHDGDLGDLRDAVAECRSLICDSIGRFE